jgi:hypothetical protein
MGKKHKKRKEHKTTTEDEKEKDHNQSSEGRPEATHTNPLYEKQQTFLLALKRKERGDFFSSSLDADRRAELWMAQADLGETLINQYSWATPDERSLRILRHFSPIVEIGCGANAYWSRLMDQAGLDVVAYDLDPTSGGKVNSRSPNAGDERKRQASGFRVRKGGPEVLREQSGRTLFLCYPDEDDEASQSTEMKEPFSMGAACLEHYTGDYVIHVGEVYGDTLAMDQAPWGRSSSPEFQQRLASEFHCILRAGLSNWLHVRDTISVWKRTETCCIVFAAGEDEGEEDEETEYRYIPEAERMPADAAAPCLLHLLQVEENCGYVGTSSVGDTERDQSNGGGDRKKTKIQGHDNSGSGESISSETGYVCPW